MKIALISLITITVVSAYEPPPKEIIAQKEGLERWSKFAETALTIEKNEAIEKLSEGVRKTGLRSIYSIDGTTEVATKLKNTLLSIPGHAEYYHNKIETMRAEVLANNKKSEAEIAKMQDDGLEVVHFSDYDRYCSMYAFPTLRHLPSPETVRVLGFYLNDPVGRDGKTLSGSPRTWPGNDAPPHPCNAELATSAIRNLGIEHPPFPPLRDRAGPSMSDEEVDAWKDWWNEVKDGKRTYRFIGSTNEYGPVGPASKEVIARTRMYRKRDEERTTGKRTVNPDCESAAVIPQRSKPFIIAGIIIACALVAGALWHFLREKRKT